MYSGELWGFFMPVGAVGAVYPVGIPMGSRELSTGYTDGKPARGTLRGTSPKIHKNMSGLLALEGGPPVSLAPPKCLIFLLLVTLTETHRGTPAPVLPEPRRHSPE
jgi:hypothetical protein